MVRAADHRFPEVEGPIRDGRLCITTVSELAKVMTEENRAGVLPRFFGCSREEAKQLVAEILPAEVVPRRTVVTVSPLLAPAEPAPVVVLPVGRDRTHPEGARPTPVQTRIHVTVSPRERRTSRCSRRR
jgi:hypothetical protein